MCVVILAVYFGLDVTKNKQSASATNWTKGKCVHSILFYSALYSVSAQFCLVQFSVFILCVCVCLFDVYGGYIDFWNS